MSRLDASSSRSGMVAGVGGESEDGVDGDDLDAGGVVEAAGADGVEGVVVGGDLAGVAVAGRLVDEVAVGVEEPVVDAPAVDADAGDLGVTGGEGRRGRARMPLRGWPGPSAGLPSTSRGVCVKRWTTSRLEPGAVEPDAGDPAALGAEVDGGDGGPGGCGGPGAAFRRSCAAAHGRGLVGVHEVPGRRRRRPTLVRYAAGTPVSEIKAVIRSTGRKGWVPNRSTLVESKMP